MNPGTAPDERGVVARIVIGLVVVAALIGATLLWWPAPDDDRATDDVPSPTAPTADPTTTPAELELDDPVEPPEVLPAAGSPAPKVAAARIRSLLGPLVGDRSLGPHAVVQVAGIDGRPLYSSGAPQLVTPASTLKLLTSTSALRHLGPQHRFETTVVAAGRDRVVLVGGGDPLLTDRPRPASQTGYPIPATLHDLARQTARELRSRGQTRIRLGYDDSLFRGPAVNPYWEPSYVPESIVSPITALWVDEGRASYGLAQRVPDPSQTAAERFAAQLREAGIRVVGPIGRTRARDGAAELAAVSSPPLQSIVQHVLEVSDNEGAEVLLRQAAIGAGRPGSFAAGTATVLATLRDLGVDTSAAVIRDGSGLSRDNAVGIATLVQTLQAAAGTDEPSLRPVVSTLPVAGFSGSLDYRFVVVAPDGLGEVRAKTGTLTGVHGLAGIVTTRLGNVVTFAAIADRVPVPRTLDARTQLDRIAAALATCRC